MCKSGEIAGRRAAFWGVARSVIRHSPFDTRQFIVFSLILVAASQLPAALLPRLEMVAAIKSGKGPYGLQVSPDGRRLFVANFASDEVGVLNLANPKSRMEMFYAGPEPVDLAISPAGDTLFVANAGSGLITVVSTKDLRMADHIKVGGRPVALAITPRGDRLFVANWGRSRVGQVDIVDLQTREVRSVKVGIRPVAVASGQNSDMVYVANGGSNSITRVELQDYQTREFPCLENPDGLALSQDGRWLYVAGANGTELALMDAMAMKEARRAVVGAGPFGIALHPSGRVMTANKGGNSISILESDLSGVAHLTVGKSPNDVVFAPDGKTAYVSLEKDNKIAVVKLQ
ncbi:MAG: YncE family protein [Acidobacteria bacterium]|nr:YncE family protein [Acidobacteriota bacterium]